MPNMKLELPPHLRQMAGGMQAAAPPQMGGLTGQPPRVDPGALRSDLTTSMQQNPQAVQQIRSQIEQSIASGEVSRESIVMMGELAKAALEDPSMYPNLRAEAIKRGLATEQQLPPEFDGGLLSVVVATADSLGPSQPNAPPPPVQGGLTQAPSPQGVPEGAYLVPAEVVRRKGTEFFDKLSQQKPNPKSGE